MNWVNKIIKSVFTKLLVVIVLTGFCINLAVIGFFFAYRKMAVLSYDRVFMQYVNYLIADLGSPPRLDRARAISHRSSLSIHYQSPELSWSTSDDPVPESLAKFHFWHSSPNIRAGTYRGRHIIMVTRGDGRFTFELTRNSLHDSRLKWFVAILGTLLTFVLLIAYLSIRWILKPVKLLKDGVQQVSRGNLEHQIPLKRSDELRDLAAAFNTMTVRIRDMLHAKEQLLLDVSHELRSPVTRMKVALEMMPESSLKDQIREDLAEMEIMVTEILETARSRKTADTVKIEPINIGLLIQRVAAEYSNQPPGIQLVDISQTGDLSGDPEKIKTVLRNILDNAFKYSSSSSKSISISMKHQAPEVIIQIQDNGIGVPADVLPYIFEPFYRVDKSRSRRTGGYGLGLSICKNIMSAHHGKIRIDSTPHIGTLVSLFFPVS
jgi:signal transduction histidine kinase